MTNNFSTAMRRAMDLTRAADVTGATRAIQEALAFGKPQTADASAGLPDLPRLPDPDTARVKSPPSGKTRKPAAGRGQKPLSEVLRILKSGRARILDLPARPRTPSVTTPQGAQFLSRVSSMEAGGRRYKVYVPARRDEPLRGMIVMLHGCQQNADDFAVGTDMNAVAEKHNFIVAYPQQETSSNAAACWNWFMRAHQLRDRGEPASIAAITRTLIAEFNVPSARVFVAGLSAGGAMAAVLAETYPDVYAAAGIHSGLAYGSATDVMSAFSVMRGDNQPTPAARGNNGAGAARLIIFQGSADATVHPSNAQRLVNGSADASWNTTETPAVDCNGRAVVRQIFEDQTGSARIEVWRIEGAGHAWSGGNASGSFADPKGPSASDEMVRFFFGDMQSA
ncbi:MAG: PHB depolymerase family esterase [Hyphomicrobiaceae bacterium]|nr:PHB depolymerase family esterase [Hyphomicrobiaceae bacterium]